MRYWGSWLGLVLLIIGAYFALPYCQPYFRHPDWPAAQETIADAQRLIEQNRFVEARERCYREIYGLEGRIARGGIEPDAGAYFQDQMLRVVADAAKLEREHSQDVAATEALLANEAQASTARREAIRSNALLDGVRIELEARSDPYVRAAWIREQLGRTQMQVNAVRAVLEGALEVCTAEVSRFEPLARDVEENVSQGRFDEAEKGLEGLRKMRLPESRMGGIQASLEEARLHAGELAQLTDLYDRKRFLERLLSGAGSGAHSAFLRRENDRCQADIRTWEERAEFARLALVAGSMDEARRRVQDLREAPGSLRMNVSADLEWVEELERVLDAEPDVYGRKRRIEVWIAELKPGRTFESACLHARLTSCEREVQAWNQISAEVLELLRQGKSAEARQVLERPGSRGLPDRDTESLSLALTEVEAIGAVVSRHPDPTECERELRSYESSTTLRSEAAKAYLSSEIEHCRGQLRMWNERLLALCPALLQGEIAESGRQLSAMVSGGCPAGLANEARRQLEEIEELQPALAALGDPYEQSERLESRFRSAPRASTLLLCWIEAQLSQTKEKIAAFERLLKEITDCLDKDDIDRAFALQGELLAANAPRRVREKIEKDLPRRPEVKGLDWVIVSRGTYWVGTPTVDFGRGKFEVDPRLVPVIQTYLISATEITQEVFREYVIDAHWTSASGDKLPAHSRSYEEAESFCRKLNEAFPGFEFDLPTESEWEIAARGKPRKQEDLLPFSVDDQESLELFRNGGDDAKQRLKRFAFFNENDPGAPAPVRQKKPNKIGMYDTAGNVFEWCRADVRIYGPTPAQFPLARPVRGGSHASAYQNCRPGARAWENPQTKKNTFGFRVVCRAR